MERNQQSGNNHKAGSLPVRCVHLNKVNTHSFFICFTYLNLTQRNGREMVVVLEISCRLTTDPAITLGNTLKDSTRQTINSTRQCQKQQRETKVAAVMSWYKGCGSLGMTVKFPGECIVSFHFFQFFHSIPLHSPPIGKGYEKKCVYLKLILYLLKI